MRTWLKKAALAGMMVGTFMLANAVPAGADGTLHNNIKVLFCIPGHNLVVVTDTGLAPDMKPTAYVIYINTLDIRSGIETTKGFIYTCPAFACHDVHEYMPTFQGTGQYNPDGQFRSMMVRGYSARGKSSNLIAPGTGCR